MDDSQLQSALNDLSAAEAMRKEADRIYNRAKKQLQGLLPPTAAREDRIKKMVLDNLYKKAYRKTG